jgi:hypothetical protein
MQLDLQTFLPRVAIVKAANTHDSSEARELCANLQDGEIVVFDKAYVDFTHLRDLDQRGVFWVTRPKKNMKYRVVGQHREAEGKIKRDILIERTGSPFQKIDPQPLRLVEATVEIDRRERDMTFITNNLSWASSSICDLYRSRWGVEVFFKQIKQTLQLADFLGHSENAVRWQIWTALLTYLLLRYIAFLSKWQGSFKRLFTLIRGVLFSRYPLLDLLAGYGTAGGNQRMIAAPQQCYLPFFDDSS